ncbi:MAG: FAD-binding oxidoreductase [Pseudochelatococcus sp.]|jgi:FAD/FMN-containing dehydrogenase|uniref:FAD-binding oxidoreductase n=1 Tax=Pseudochelatococcus sp. TaxID=2020869 RepID=UPI003D8C9BDE
MSHQIVEGLIGLLGEKQVLVGEDAAAYLTDRHGRLRGNAVCVARPGSTEEVAGLVRLARRFGFPVVPQGGNTGLVGGATPDETGNAVVLSTVRLNRIRNVDAQDNTLIAEAGCTLSQVQAAALDADRLFPLSLGSEGSCTIGGNLSTNAGGTQVLHYGNTRALTLGLEVVTADGEIWHGLNGLRKDNTGYSLRDVFIGAEGTLGVVTAATLKLFPRPASQTTAFLSFAGIHAVIGFFDRARAHLGPSLTAFELVSGLLYKLVESNVPEQPLPLPASAAHWYVLLEISGVDGEEQVRERLAALVGPAIERQLVLDAVVADSPAKTGSLWRLRHGALGEAQRRDGPTIKHDIALPVSRIPDFLDAGARRLNEHTPGIRPLVFGHLGDGNLHFNLARAPGQSPEELLRHEEALHEITYDTVHQHGGAISAEHGIGQVKRHVLPRYKDPVALKLMKKIKLALDPEGLFNPGKVL